ncbi:DUF1489 family protein [Sphingomonas japonica]|uniref:DUF1489 family protein n=1 Tax=Sphingomonas japonica TaxID=511662 RepID=A0ABX0U069_9SPHN|nr:DUF1489 domain-containing protein [Sphingomonas japonica]NIJ23969.1 hypothetical protein [Sphingomonas japonica]
MPLHLTKVAFGANSVEDIQRWFDARLERGPLTLTTRYLPKRHAEVLDGGSLYWIFKHQLVGRSPVLRFGEADGGRVAIELEPRLVLVQARPKRAHQGWRYLEANDAPIDLGQGAAGVADMPTAMVGKLAELGLL